MHDLTGKSILFTDDEREVRELVAWGLRSLGAHVVEASDAETALKLYGEGPYDVVLTDFTMPGMKGDLLAQTIRQQNPGQRIVMLSGFAEQLRQNGNIPHYLDALVNKPCLLEDLSVALFPEQLHELQVAG